METFEGLLIDTYVLQEQPMMLTGINLQREDRVINGLLKDRYLAKYILRLPLNKYVLEVSGKWNRRNQLVIKKMLIKNIDEYINKNLVWFDAIASHNSVFLIFFSLYYPFLLKKNPNKRLLRKKTCHVHIAKLAAFRYNNEC